MKKKLLNEGVYNVSYSNSDAKSNSLNIGFYLFNAKSSGWVDLRLYQYYDQKNKSWKWNAADATEIREILIKLFGINWNEADALTKKAPVDITTTISKKSVLHASVSLRYKKKTRREQPSAYSPEWLKEKQRLFDAKAKFWGLNTIKDKTSKRELARKLWDEVNVDLDKKYGRDVWVYSPYFVKIGNLV